MHNSISTLNDLIEILKDGQEGFQAAAKDVESADLKALFNEYSLQRSSFAGKLQALVVSLGEPEPETGGSVAGALHRGWIDLKSAVSTQDSHAILAECERGEDSAVAGYRAVLDDPDLPADLRATVEKQFMGIKAAHDRVKALRDSLAPKEA
ncbi:MAG: hypothetical protein JWO08_4689 [Verrucomicrobiaceae bacterium]|nr:hypothetical protein [Verrucomicrobiaceae bacterium]